MEEKLNQIAQNKTKRLVSQGKNNFFNCYFCCVLIFLSFKRCPQCESNYVSPISTCFAENLTASQCVSRQGFVDPVTNVCVFAFYNKTMCAAQNLTFETCETLSYEQCSACVNETNCPLKTHKLLKCFYNSQRFCEESLPESECLAREYCLGNYIFSFN